MDRECADRKIGGFARFVFSRSNYYYFINWYDQKSNQF